MMGILVSLRLGVIGEAALANAVNLYVVQLKLSPSWGPMPEGLISWLDGYPDGAAAQLAHLRYLVALGDLRQALDFLEGEGQTLAQFTIVAGPPVDPLHIHSLPCYHFTNHDGDQELLCPTEVPMTVEFGVLLSKAGLAPLLHLKNTDRAVFVRVPAIGKRG